MNQFTLCVDPPQVSGTEWSYGCTESEDYFYGPSKSHGYVSHNQRVNVRNISKYPMIYIGTILLVMQDFATIHSRMGDIAHIYIYIRDILVGDKLVLLNFWL